MTLHSYDPDDVALPRSETRFAWQRTALEIGIYSLLWSRLMLGRAGEDVLALLGYLGIAAAAALYLGASIRHSGRRPVFNRAPWLQLALLLGTVGAGVVALVVIALSLLPQAVTP
ncbi:hypothetical protein [Gulosibacter sediminis]|uniref:hypothetical protein n=1 Tax=Gulosibacter sediminis TaxID=1729695 RepID=UPI0024A81509|nr:hypothetical protein [Gulosibacter sediminis]